MRRRTVLTTVVATGTLAGCVSQLPGISAPGFRLGSIVLENATVEARTVDIRLLRNGEHAFNGLFDLDPGDENIIHSEWSSEPAEYLVDCVFSGDDQLRTFTLHERHDVGGACNVFQIRISDSPNEFESYIFDIADVEAEWPGVRC